MKISRKEFLKLSAVLVGAKVSGCSDDTPPNPNPTSTDPPTSDGRDLGVAEPVTAGPDLATSPSEADIASSPSADLSSNPNADLSTGGARDMASPRSNPDLATPACMVASQISANHGHYITVPSADVRAAVAKSYDITGVSDHPHTVSLGADDFVALGQNQTITITSTYDDGHDHRVTLRCA